MFNFVPNSHTLTPFKKNYIIFCKVIQELSAISRPNHAEGVYIINAKHCISSATCCGISSMQSIVYHQAAGRCTLARDDIQGRHCRPWWYTALRRMICQACGLDKQKQNICLPTNVLFLLAGIAGFEPAKMPESKSGALPLGDIPIFNLPIMANISIIPQNTFYVNLFLLDFEKYFTLRKGRFMV